MRDLIEALVILLKYENIEAPTHCRHDELIIAGIDPADVSVQDILRLDVLGFSIQVDDADDEEKDWVEEVRNSNSAECLRDLGAYFVSYRYGSS